MECVLCTLREVKRCEQIIGKISPSRVTPSPPFESVLADVSGPYIVWDRSSSKWVSKVWALIYLCDSTKALHTEVVKDYSGTGLILFCSDCMCLGLTEIRVSGSVHFGSECSPQLPVLFCLCCMCRANPQ